MRQGGNQYLKTVKQKKQMSFLQGEKSNSYLAAESKINSSQLINLQMVFGDDGGQDQLLNLKAKMYSEKSTNIIDKHKQLLKQIQSKEEVNNDTLLVFKFQVQTGRQRESFQFIQKGLDQDDSNENTSAMQRLFHRPKTTGKIQLKEGKGFIYVIYRFYEEQIESHVQDIVRILDSNIQLDLSLQVVLKGTSEPSKRSFTAVKPDYLRVKLDSQKVRLRDFMDFLQKRGQIMEDQQNNQIYQLFKNLQVAHFDLKFNSFRQIMKYYHRIIYDDENGECDRDPDEREWPLLNKGIFRNSASAHLILGNKLAIQVEIKYKSEQIMLRLIARFYKMYESL